MVPTLDGFDAVNAVCRYFQYIDAKDFDGMRSLLTDEVTFDYGGALPFEGKVDADEVKRTLAEVFSLVPLVQHMVTSPVADIDGDVATVRSYLQALHHHPDLGEDEQTTDWTVYARSVIGLRRTPEGWRISSHHLTVVHQTENTDFPSDLQRLAADAGA